MRGSPLKRKRWLSFLDFKALAAFLNSLDNCLVLLVFWCCSGWWITKHLWLSPSFLWKSHNISQKLLLSSKGVNEHLATVTCGVGLMKQTSSSADTVAFSFWIESQVWLARSTGELERPHPQQNNQNVISEAYVSMGSSETARFSRL